MTLTRSVRELEVITRSLMTFESDPHDHPAPTDRPASSACSASARHESIVPRLWLSERSEP
jgi:hypothetical protein